MSRDGAFRLVALSCLDDLTRHRKATCSGSSDALHQMRMASMRLRAVVSFFAPMTSDQEWVRLRSGFKWMNHYLGTTRDLDVIMKKLATSKRRQADTEFNQRIMERQRIDSHRRLAKALQSTRFRKLTRNTSDWIESGHWSTQDDERAERRRSTRISAYAARRLKRWSRKLHRKSRKLELISASKRHRLRIETKKFRYTVEFFGHLLPAFTAARQRALLKYLREAQDALGDLNDAEAARSFTATLKPATQKATARHSLDLGKKREKRLTQAAAAAYRRIAKLDLFSE
jgi:CHAD domain-containing protein